jgi:hypothetical protein
MFLRTYPFALQRSLSQSCAIFECIAKIDTERQWASTRQDAVTSKNVVFLTITAVRTNILTMFNSLRITL